MTAALRVAKWSFTKVTEAGLALMVCRVSQLPRERMALGSIPGTLRLFREFFIF